MGTNEDVSAIREECAQGWKVRRLTVEIPNKEFGSWRQVIELMQDGRNHRISAHACMLILVTTSPPIYVGDNQHHVPRETYAYQLYSAILVNVCVLFGDRLMLDYLDTLFEQDANSPSRV